MKKSNFEGYLLVPPLVPRACTGCVFMGCTAPDSMSKECHYYDDYDDFVDVGIYIEDTDEAKARYAAARLGVTT